MIANNAAGTRAPRYGATKDNILRLEVVLTTGEIIRVGSRAKKSASGYDLVHLFVGSEGTLGVITEATLRLAPLPDQFSAVIASFATVDEAARAVSSILGSGLIPAALEFLDPATMHTLNACGEFGLPERPILLIEFHSAIEAGLKGEQIPQAARIVAVVDVWNALRSDRPYRPAWSEEKVHEHLQQLAGVHFDPRVVEIVFTAPLSILLASSKKMSNGLLNPPTASRRRTIESL